MTAHRLRLAVVVLAALPGLIACSSDSEDEGEAFDASSAPTDASVADFCEVMEDFAFLEPQVGDDVHGLETDGTDWPAELVEVGTPADMTEQEREGFELYVETYEAWQERSGFERDEDLSEDEDAAWSAFYTGYVYRHCDPYGEHE